MTAEEYFKEWSKVCRDLSGKQIYPHKTMLQFAEAYHKVELERLVEEVDGVMVDITKRMYLDMVSAAAFRGILLKIAGIE